MSLYRTWRPLTFGDLVGQDAVVRTLTAAIESGKLAHAYLFSGPRGSGKTSAAKILARCINCLNGPTANPDNTCENCKAMLAGTALDVLEIDAASNRGIDEIRALREAVKFAPSAMRMKIYIIDEAHMLTKEGANAFLKTLEEPPPHALFILATTEPEKLPVTILSRCQRYAFRRISVPVIIEKLREIARGENIPIDDDALAAIAYRAEGGLRDALTMLEQIGAYAGGETASVETLDRAFGSMGRNFAQALVEAAIVKDAKAALAVVEEASDAGTDMQMLIRALIAAFRNLLIARIDPELLARDLAAEDAQRAGRQSAEIPQAMLVRALRVFSDAFSLARLGGNARLELETALLRFILAGEDPTLEALGARVATLEEQRAQNVILSEAKHEVRSEVEGRDPNVILSEAPAGREVEGPAQSVILSEAPTGREVEGPDPNVILSEAKHEVRSEVEGPARKPALSERSESKGKASESPSLQKIRAAWQTIRGRIESRRQSLRAPLSRAVVDALQNNTLVLKLPDSWSADTLRDHAATIEAAIADVLGVSLSVRLRVDGSGAAPPAQSQNDADALFDYASQRIR